jgi:Uma2 family endonuclease
MSSTPSLPPANRARSDDRSPHHPDGEPVWDLAYLYPPQGEWSVEAYLELPGNLLVEFTDGQIEVLPMPTLAHQFIVLYLYRLLNALIQTNRLGWVLAGPLPVRLGPRIYREPDVIFISAERPERRAGDYPDGAEIVTEVLSGGRKDRQRDLVAKRAEYAAAGIGEYWIIDPQKGMVAVLRLEGNAYIERGRFRDGQATSALLPGFAAPVADVFAAT